MRAHILSLLLFISLATCAVSQRQTTSQGPEEVARQFCVMDSDAVRLDGRISRPMWELTTGEGEPPSTPIYVISGFRISQPRPSGSGVTIKVEYDIVANVSEETLVLRPVKRTQTFTLHLVQMASAWRIDVSTLKLSPHVSPVALARYYEGLLADTPVQDSARRNTLSRTIRQLKRFSESKPHDRLRN